MPRRGAGRRVSPFVVVSSAEISSMGELLRASARPCTPTCGGTGQPRSIDGRVASIDFTREWWNLVLASIVKRIRGGGQGVGSVCARRRATKRSRMICWTRWSQSCAPQPRPYSGRANRRWPQRSGERHPPLRRACAAVYAWTRTDRGGRIGREQSRQKMSGSVISLRGRGPE